MNVINGNVLQKTLSKAFPNKIIASLLELLLVVIMGVAAVIIHAKLRMPMNLPGKHGVIFIAMLIVTRSFSKYPFATSLACLSASLTLFLFPLGFKDPFIPYIYFALGIITDVLFKLSSAKKYSFIFISIAGAVGWMAIPLLRLLFAGFTGFIYHSLLLNPFYSVFMHLIFGLIGGFAGSGVFLLINKFFNK